MLRPGRCIRQMSYFPRIGEPVVFSLNNHPHPDTLNHLPDDGPPYATLVERSYPRGGPGPWHRDEQPSTGLRVVEWEQVILVHAVRLYTVLQVLPIALQSARVDAVVRKWHGPLPDRNIVSGRGDADLAHRVAGGLVEEGGRLYGVFYLLLREDVSLERRRQDTETERFGQNQGVSRFGTRVAHDPVFLHEACHGETVLGLLVLDRVTAAEPRS